MTIPIIPGPFSWLQGAGQAAGNLGTELEVRKQHAEKLTADLTDSVMTQIMNGADPAILDEPGIKQAWKKRFGFEPSSAMYKALGGKARAEGLTGEAEIKHGLPEAKASEEVAGATAGTAQANLAGATAQAELTEGIPELDAETKAAQDRATKAGARLNTSIFQGARALLGTDPKFARLAEEAATGALDAKFRYLEYARAGLSLERQRDVDSAHALHDISTELDKAYQAELKSWGTRRNQVTALITDPKKKDKADAQWILNNPPPERDAVYTKELKSYGYTMQDFQRRYRSALERVFSGGGPGEAVGPPPQGAKPSPQVNLQAMVQGAMSLKPEDAAAAIVNDLNDGSIVDEQVRIIKRSLMKMAPGDWFRKFNRALVTGTTPEPADTTQ